MPENSLFAFGAELHVDAGLGAPVVELHLVGDLELANRARHARVGGLVVEALQSGLDGVELALELRCEHRLDFLVLEEDLLDAIDGPLLGLVGNVRHVGRQRRCGERVGGAIEERPVVHGEAGVANGLERQRRRSCAGDLLHVRPGHRPPADASLAVGDDPLVRGDADARRRHIAADAQLVVSGKSTTSIYARRGHGVFCISRSRSTRIVETSRNSWTNCLGGVFVIAQTATPVRRNIPKRERQKQPGLDPEPLPVEHLVDRHLVDLAANVVDRLLDHVHRVAVLPGPLRDR